MSVFISLLLSVVILTLTTLVVIAGIQVLHILHEFRLTLQRVNKILDNTQTLSEASAKPLTAVNDFFSEVKTLVDATQDEIIESTPDRLVTKPQIEKHFFRRSGLSLRSS